MSYHCHGLNRVSLLKGSTSLDSALLKHTNQLLSNQHSRTHNEICKSENNLVIVNYI